MAEEKKYREKDEEKRKNKVDEEKKEEIDHKKLAEKYLNNWKRCQADFENYKKDQAKMMNEFRKFANMDMILQILSVLDNFNVSLEHVPENEKGDAWVTGIIYIKKQLEDVLKNYGVEEIDVKEGDQFNPVVHEAVEGDHIKSAEADHVAGTKEPHRIKKIG